MAGNLSALKLLPGGEIFYAYIDKVVEDTAGAPVAAGFTFCSTQVFSCGSTGIGAQISSPCQQCHGFSLPEREVQSGSGGPSSLVAELMIFLEV